MTRDQKQDDFVGRFRKIFRAYLEACTGFGKTRIALKIIRLMLIKFPRNKTHIVVPTTKLKDQWEKEIAQWGLTNCHVFVVNTFCKLSDEERACDLLIADEAHRYSNEEAEWFSVVLTSKHTYLLALSATFSPEHKLFMHKLGISSIGIVTLEEAIENLWVAPFKQHVLYLPIHPQTSQEYDKFSKEFNKQMGFFGWDFNAGMKCLNKSYRDAYAIEHNMDSQELGYRAARLNLSIQKRKEILYKDVNKAQAAVELINNLQDKVITFSESVEFADTLTENLGDIALSYHSYLESQFVREARKKQFKTLKAAKSYADANAGKISETSDGFVVTSHKMVKYGKDRLKELALKKLQDNRYKIRVINTARSLDEGADLPSLSNAIIASGTSVKRQQVQRIGRVVRLSSDANKEATIINLVTAETQDAEWARRRLYGLRVDNYFYNINDLIEHVRGSNKVLC